jgi:hypothetical protein
MQGTLADARVLQQTSTDITSTQHPCTADCQGILPKPTPCMHYAVAQAGHGTWGEQRSKLAVRPVHPPEQLARVEVGLVQVGGAVTDAEGQPASVVDLHQHPHAHNGAGCKVGDGAPEVDDVGEGADLLGGVATHACAGIESQQQQQQQRILSLKSMHQQQLTPARY